MKKLEMALSGVSLVARRHSLLAAAVKSSRTLFPISAAPAVIATFPFKIPPRIATSSATVHSLPLVLCFEPSSRSFPSPRG